MKRVFIAVSLLACVTSLALTLDDFQTVHKAIVVREGTNRVRVKFPSAEWGTGIK